jgi:hypothetical protein
MSQPKWATAPTKDAIATAQGWKSPKGELLVSHKGLDAKIKALGGTPPEIAVEVVELGAEEATKETSKKKKKKK